MKEKILLSWSGGKDSAMALYEIQKGRNYDISALLTTITDDYDRISIHGVRRVLLEQQAKSLGLPLQKALIPKDSTNEIYESRINAVLANHKEEGIDSVAFGDLFLEDIKKYREAHLGKIGMRGLFPIWHRDTTELLNTFLQLGFKAIIVCVNLKMLDGSFAGKTIDGKFLDELPSNIDPCGENGEFHSFVFDGPIFDEEVKFTLGETVVRNDACFCDLLPADLNAQF
ncbi:MAG: diphthine--ammonia ligase [Caldithrix sp.]|nr:MAG: diphthine--ammonia ligase [Caldithrix sp.]